MKKLLFLTFAALCMAACDCPTCPSQVFNTNTNTVYVYDTHTVGIYNFSQDIRLTSSYNWSVQNHNPDYISLNAEGGAGGAHFIQPEFTEVLKTLLANPAANFELTADEGYKIGVLTFNALQHSGLSQSVTLYYRPDVTLSFNENPDYGGSGEAPLPITGHIYQSINLPGQGSMSGPEDYHILVGWGERADDDTVVNDPYILTEDIMLFAIWGVPEPILTVTYHANDGGPDFEEKPYYSVPTALAAASLFTAPTHHTYYCWSTSPNGRGDNYRAGEALPTDTPTLDLYALWSGDGVADRPILISTQPELAAISTGLDKHYKLVGNIALEGNWTPVGAPTNNDPHFSGSLDGNDRTISNLEIANVQNAGLFGRITGVGSGVKDLHIALGANGIEGSYRAGAVTGRITSGTISGCSVKGAGTIRVTGPGSGSPSNESVAGGVVGSVYTSAVVENCYVEIEVVSYGSNSNYAGGIASYIDNSAIRNCYAGGATSAKGSSGGNYAGGIVGYVHKSGRVDNCYATGVVSANGGTTRNYGGGLVGYTTNSGSNTIQNCVALNNNVVADGTNPFGRRVLGRYENIANVTLNNNYGFTEMLKNGGTGAWTSAPNGQDGANCAIIPTANWWTTTSNLNWNFDAIWEVTAGQLPKLR